MKRDIKRDSLPSEKEAFILLSPIDAGEFVPHNMTLEQQEIFSADIILNLAKQIRNERKAFAERIGLRVESLEFMKGKFKGDIFREPTDDVYKRYGEPQEDVVYLSK